MIAQGLLTRAEVMDMICGPFTAADGNRSRIAWSLADSEAAWQRRRELFWPQARELVQRLAANHYSRAIHLALLALNAEHGDPASNTELRLLMEEELSLYGARPKSRTVRFVRR